MQINFNPGDTSGLTDAFRAKPVSSGVLAVFSGGRRPDRYFAAWLMAGELGLPLVESCVPLAGCVTFIEHQLQTGNPGGVLSPGGVLTPGGVLNPGGVLGVPIPGVAAPKFGFAAKSIAGAVTVLSLNDPAPTLESSADLVIRFSADGRPVISPPPALGASGSQDRIDACCHFQVAIGGQPFGFSEISAVTMATQAARGSVHPNIVLRRAITLNKDLFIWRMKLANGEADIRPVNILHLSAGSEPVRQWWIEGAWPVRWSGPMLDSMASRPAMEEIEIAVSRIDWR